MAIGPNTNWYVRVSGGNTNGGGYDATISGAGTNYADQDSPQVTFSSGNGNRLNTSGAGSAIVTSDGTPFTSGMVGNCIRISGGTNFDVGYYFIVTYTSSSQVTLDRSPTAAGAGSVGTGNLGGAFGTVGALADGGSLGSALTNHGVTTPLAAGHTVNVRGAGSDLPSSADYTHTGGYWSFPAGSPISGEGVVRWVGYNGRPRFHHNGLLWHGASDHVFYNFYFKQTVGTVTTLGVVNESSGGVVENCIFDAGGFDAGQLQCGVIRDVWVFNSGGGAAGIRPAIYHTGYTTVLDGVYIEGVRGLGILTGNAPTIRRAIIRAVGSHGIHVSGTSAALFPSIDHVVCYGCGGSGIYIDVPPSLNVSNSVLYGNGGYGIRVNSVYGTGTNTNNARHVKTKPRNCAFGSNTSGKYQNLTGTGDIDLSADPFIDAANGNFMLNDAAGGGALLVGGGFPESWRGSLTENFASVGAAEIERPSPSAVALAMWSHANRTLTS